MPNIIVAGAQWGDEGKGKVVDLLTEKVQVVARFNGGHNAGHTIKFGTQQFILHLIPAGILHPGILCVMGNGMVIDPWALEKEMGELVARGVAVDDNLVISDRAHLILPHHRALEAMEEEGRGAVTELRTRMTHLSSATQEVDQLRGRVLKAYQEKLHGRMQELLGTQMDQDRILQEAIEQGPDPVSRDAGGILDAVVGQAARDDLAAGQLGHAQASSTGGSWMSSTALPSGSRR